MIIAKEELLIQLFASRVCPICEFPSALCMSLTNSSVVLQCQTCKKEYLYKRINHIENILLEMSIQE